MLVFSAWTTATPSTRCTGPGGTREIRTLWEMPEVLEVPVEGTDGRRWVKLLSINPGGIAGGSGLQYFTGEFDGVTFRAQGAAGPEAPLQDHQWVDYGADFYAATTISGAPGGKPVLFGWMGNWDYAQKMPTTPWRRAMAIPRELTLSGGSSNGNDDGGRPAWRSSIASVPAGVLSSGAASERQLTVADESKPLGEDFSSRSRLLDVELTPDGAAEAGIELRGPKIRYQAQSGALTVDRSAAGTSDFSDKFSPYHEVSVPLADEKLKLRLLIATSSVEVFRPRKRHCCHRSPPADWSNTDTSVFSEGGKTGFTLTGRKLA